MNAPARISDHHSIAYNFEDLQPEIAGIRLDAYFSGTAELASDPNYSFYVRTITLPGTIPDKLSPASYFGRRPRKSAPLILSRPDKFDHSEAAALFRLIEAAIYEDQEAVDAWQAEMEPA